jgi:pentose-5-phosphate-3-epimerase
VISFVKTVIKVDHSMKGASNQKIKYSRLNIIVFNSTLFNNASSAASQISLCRSC